MEKELQESTMAVFKVTKYVRKHRKFVGYVLLDCKDIDERDATFLGLGYAIPAPWEYTKDLWISWTGVEDKEGKC